MDSPRWLDPMGAVFLLDFFALQEKEYRWILEELPQIYTLIWGPEYTEVARYVPNIFFSESLASFLLLEAVGEKEKKAKTMSAVEGDNIAENDSNQRASKYAETSARLQEAIRRFPALAQALAFGEEADTNLGALEKLYFERCSSQWRMPNVAQWLYTAMTDVNDGAASFGLGVGEMGQASQQIEALSLMSPEQQLTICRHAYLSGLPRKHWPLSDWMRKAQLDETIWAFDPLPPLDTIHPTPVDTFFNGEDDQEDADEPSSLFAWFTSALSSLNLY